MNKQDYDAAYNFRNTDPYDYMGGMTHMPTVSPETRALAEDIATCYRLSVPKGKPVSLFELGWFARGAIDHVATMDHEQRAAMERVGASSFEELAEAAVHALKALC